MLFFVLLAENSRFWRSKNLDTLVACIRAVVLMRSLLRSSGGHPLEVTPEWLRFSNWSDLNSRLFVKTSSDLVLTEKFTEPCLTMEEDGEVKNSVKHISRQYMSFYFSRIPHLGPLSQSPVPPGSSAARASPPPSPAWSRRCSAGSAWTQSGTQSRPASEDKVHFRYNLGPGGQLPK